jgi:hypothetical protein
MGELQSWSECDGEEKEPGDEPAVIQLIDSHFTE